MSDEQAIEDGEETATPLGGRRWALPAGLPLAFVVGVLGCAIIYSTSMNQHDASYFAVRQAFWLVLGLGVYSACSRLSAERLIRATPWLTGIMLVALVGVLIVGSARNGMTGWYAFKLPFGGRYFKDILIQPSELAKPVFVLFVAWIIGKHPREASPDWREYGIIIAQVAGWLLLLGLQPDFGTALVYAGGFAIMYWVRGGRPVHLAATALAAVPVCIGIYRAFPYVQRRLAGFMDPEGHADAAGWHVLQNRAALAGGGWWGQWNESGAIDGGYLPHAHNDSIFAAYGELAGLFGVLTLTVGLAIWLGWIAWQAQEQANQRQALIVAGIAGIVGVQAIVHISVTVGLLPPTGVTLPFLSYGGSSLIGTLASLGIVIALRRERAPDAPTE